MVEKQEGKEYCPVCWTEVQEGYNFCPSCGEPLTDLAKELIKEQKNNNDIALLVKLVDYVKDEKTTQFLQGLIEKLSSK